LSVSESLPALAALGSAACWAVGLHLFRRSLARTGIETARPTTAAAANLFKNALALGLFVIAFVAIDGSLPPAGRWSVLFWTGVLGFAVGDTLFLAALPRCGVQITAMVALVHVPAAVILGWVLNSEQLAPLALLGAASIVAGLVLVLTEAQPAKSAISARAPLESRARRIGIACAALAAVAQAVAVVVGHGAMQGAEVLGGTIVRICGGVVGAFALAVVLGAIDPKLRMRSELADLVRPWRERSARRGLLIAALFGSVLGLPLFHLALRALPSGVAAVLFATTPLFTLPLGLFLGERHGWRAAFGAVLGITGVAVVVSAAT
jgi:drug/metabolite transporter (DMT)-like permease